MLINRIYCAVHTRDEVGADTSDKGRLFLDGNIITEFPQSIPAQGKAGILESDAVVDYEGLVCGNLAIGIAGADRWGPRSIFLWAKLNTGDLVPVAENLDCIPYSWVCQDLTQGTDRLQLKAITYQSEVQSSSYNPYITVEGLVVVIETWRNPVDLLKNPEMILEHHIFDSLRMAGLTVDEKSKPRLLDEVMATRFFALDTADRGTVGPIYIRISASASALTENPENISATVFQTELARRGAQTPGAASEVYLAHFDTSYLAESPSRLYDIVIRNLSDDPWKPKRIFIFSLGGRRQSSTNTRSRLLAYIENNIQWISQNPHVTTLLSASQAIRMFANYRTILD